GAAVECARRAADASSRWALTPMLQATDPAPCLQNRAGRDQDPVPQLFPPGSSFRLLQTALRQPACLLLSAGSAATRAPALRDSQSRKPFPRLSPLREPSGP